MATNEKLDGFMRVAHLIYTIESAKNEVAEETGTAPDILEVGSLLAGEIRNMMATWPGVFKDFTAEGHRHPASFDSECDDSRYIGNVCGMDLFESELDLDTIQNMAVDLNHLENLVRVRVAH